MTLGLFPRHSISFHSHFLHLVFSLNGCKKGFALLWVEIYLPLLLFVVKLKNEIAIEGKRFIDWKMCIKSTRAGDLHDRFYLANNNSLEPNCANCVLCPRYSQSSLTFPTGSAQTHSKHHSMRGCKGMNSMSPILWLGVVVFGMASLGLCYGNDHSLPHSKKWL